MKLTKTQKAEHANRLVACEVARDALITAREAHEAAVLAAFETLQQAVTTYNAALHAAWETHLTAPLATYTRAVEEVTEYVTETAEELRNQIAERSERWQESDKGQAAESLVGEWEEFSADPYELEEIAAFSVGDYDPRDQFGEDPEDIVDTFGALPLDTEDA